MDTPKHLQADFDNVAGNAPVHSADAAADRGAELNVISAAEQELAAEKAKKDAGDVAGAAPADLKTQIEALKAASDEKIQRVRGEETDGGDIIAAVEAQEEVAEATGTPAPKQVGETPGDVKAASGDKAAEAKAKDKK